ncbi:hypothetical protein ACRALDRAFT_210486 [Sodiomyces alcalophilus JCM 7366]|uniref:uncharacterized protein n=1 Tax=Sodiomyces alcalophilus JCM 7366 TaxID=591952 RepID=UPI0039B46CBF
MVTVSLSVFIHGTTFGVHLPQKLGGKSANSVRLPQHPFPYFLGIIETYMILHMSFSSSIPVINEEIEKGQQQKENDRQQVSPDANDNNNSTQEQQ